MATSNDQQQFPDPAPLSPSAGGHESRDHYLAQDATQPVPRNEPYLTPYLGLRARLSQTWINRWSILLLLVLFRTIFTISSLDDNIATARREALSACTSVENVGSAMASMPYYMSSGVNALVADGIDKAVEALKDMLLLILTGVEEIVVFVINMMTSTYLCLITLAVTGSLKVAIEVAEDVGNFLNSTVKGVGNDLGSAASDFQNAMNGFMKDLDDIGSFLSGKTLTPPTINLNSSIQKLDSLQLPSDYDTDLQKLNSSIPTFAQVKNFTTQVIEFPFEEVKKLLNESIPTYKTNASLFPVPPKQQLTFCSDNNSVESFFDDLVKVEQIAKKIFLAVLIVGIIAAMAPMAYREIRGWRFMKRRADLLNTGKHDQMDAVYLVSRPYTSSAGLWLSRKFQTSRVQTIVRWTIAYATTIPALFVLSLAVASLLACACQYILLKVIAKEVPILENEIIGFADKVINSINNASEQWTVEVNDVINNTSTKLNHDLFGWVNTTTGAVNETLNVFVNETINVLNITFGGTILYTPILDVLNCLVLLKIQGIEKGLTWVSDHAHIDFPQLANDTFSLGTIAKVSGSSASILDTGSNGGAANDINAAVQFIIRALEKAVKQEGILALCLLLIWVFVAVVGFIRAVYLLYGGKGLHDLNFGIRHLKKGSTGSDGMPPADPDGKFEMDDFMHPAAPSYEQATATAVPGDHSANQYNGQSYTIPGDHTANQYNGQSYTLTPTPMPSFDFHSPNSPILSTSAEPGNEKVRTVGGQHVDSAIRRPTHFRTSSHGDYDVTSPITPPAGQSTFLTVPFKSKPFGAPRR